MTTHSKRICVSVLTSVSARAPSEPASAQSNESPPHPFILPFTRQGALMQNWATIQFCLRSSALQKIISAHICGRLPLGQLLAWFSEELGSAVKDELWRLPWCAGIQHWGATHIRGLQSPCLGLKHLWLLMLLFFSVRCLCLTRFNWLSLPFAGSHVLSLQGLLCCPNVFNWGRWKDSSFCFKEYFPLNCQL